MSKKRQHRDDKSIHVPQKPKLKNELHIRPFKWTNKQQELIRIIQDKETNIVLIKGFAGVAKTLIAVYCALEALNAKKVGEVVYLRNPVESSSHTLGLMPGEFDVKMHYFLFPLLDKLDELLPPSEVNSLMNEKKISGGIVGHLRGKTYHNCFTIADEFSQCTKAEILTTMTRIGKFSKMLILGDATQVDIKNSGFKDVFDAFNNDEAKKNGIHTFEFGKEDILRSPITRFIIETFEKIASK